MNHEEIKTRIIYWHL